MCFIPQAYILNPRQILLYNILFCRFYSASLFSLALKIVLLGLWLLWDMEGKCKWNIITRKNPSEPIHIENGM